MNDSKLLEIITELKRKPGHENVRAMLYDLLVNGLDIDLKTIQLEESLKEIRGRMDAILGRTIIEIKSNLDNESGDAERQLLKYLQEKEAGGDAYVGIATDGAVFKVYARERDGDVDKLDLIGQCEPDTKEPRKFLIWLESILIFEDKLPPEPDMIKMKLGRGSIFYNRSLSIISKLWDDLENNSEVETKYLIWKRLLNTAYGSEIEGNRLFLQHTYLTIVAKSIATAALLSDTIKVSGENLLNGDEFRKLGILGAVESDFFDWILVHDSGEKFVKGIANHVQKFNWAEIETDILKVLYENLIDPDERKGLGEYYTPDWLAEKICKHVIKSPLSERIIDPSCGSGTFLFHAVRLGLEKAKQEKVSLGKAIQKITLNVSGIDVHPIAVIFARVTYLLALLPALSERSSASISLPVYLGDSLQWGLQEIMDKEDLEIIVPSKGDTDNFMIGGSNGKSNGRIILKFPQEIAQDANLFDKIVDEMLSLAEAKGTENSWKQWLKAKKITSNRILDMLVQTYKDLCTLQEQKRNHIWGYVARNLSRPVWLASDKQKADIIIGNPPWVRYSNMGITIQTYFRDRMEKAGLWVGGKVATSQDLSSYFYMRVCELYMREEGQIAFVVPHALLDREPHKKFRLGRYRKPNQNFLSLKFTEAWDLEAVKANPNFFPIHSCVIFAKREGNDVESPFLTEVTYFSGHLVKKDAKLSEVKDDLKSEQRELIAGTQNNAPTFYRKRFRQGAKLKPRILSFVEVVQEGKLGKNMAAPLVRGIELNKSKNEWGDNFSPPEGQVEAEFIKPVYLSECIAPYISFNPKTAVISWDDQLLNSEEAYESGFEKLSRWLKQVENIWTKNRKKDDETFLDYIDYYKSLSKQFPLADKRVVYNASGSYLTATLIENSEAVIESNLYWTTIESMEEAFYLLAVFNSKVLNDMITPWKKGWHIDKIVFNAQIPQFSKKDSLHLKISTAGKKAQKLVDNMTLTEVKNAKIREEIRNNLSKNGIAGEIDKLVAQLLNL